MSTNRGALKSIAPVPTAGDFLDIVLSKTQRKTPTEIHKNFKISRIRGFYMRKVKFAQDAFEERLDQILSEFPILDNLHPFMSSLLNVLYDKNHYKLALGQINTARHLIDSVGKDYARLLKFGDSLYRCKQLKKAALGRMATIIKRQKDPLAYLEQVRQHMSRLPAIDPTTRTLLCCGYPNVGKSSFINKVTRADVDVQPYAFTTKSLFVGHLDYQYLRWQVIDTPGILDHPLDEMNTIEMQSITALAHLRSCVLYFMDLSEQCGYTIEAQCKLFESIKPLFANKPTYIVINKIDIVRPEDLDEKNRTMLESLVEENISIISLSCISEEGVMDVRNAACDALLAHRVETKEKTKRADNVTNRIRVAQPMTRDGIERKPHIPEAVLQRKKYDAEDPERRMLERDLEAEGGGAGVFVSDLNKQYLLKNDDWKYDAMPEVHEGKNLADFIDPDIANRLEELEAEEERLQEEGFYDSDDPEEEEDASDDDAIRQTAAAIRKRRTAIKTESQEKKKQGTKARVPLPRTSGATHRTQSDVTNALKRAGYDTSSLEQRAALTSQARKALRADKRKRDTDDVEMDGSATEGADSSAWADASMDVDDDGAEAGPSKRTKGNTGVAAKKPVKSNKKLAGLRDEAQWDESHKILSMARKERNRLGKAGEADRHVRIKKPKHLFAGKRGMGTANHR